MVITRPKGANPVKFFTRVVSSHWMPAVVKKFWEVTILWEAGFSRAKPAWVQMAPTTAVITNRMQNRMAGGGSLLQTRSTVFRKRSNRLFFVAFLVSIESPPLFRFHWKETTFFFFQKDPDVL